MRIWKFEFMTVKGLHRRLRNAEKDGHKSAGFEMATADKVLFGHNAYLSGCNLDGKVVMLGDNSWLTHNTIIRKKDGIAVKVC